MAKAEHDSTQADKFRELARELGCDEDEKAFEEAVKRIAPKAPPDTESAKRAEQGLPRNWRDDG